MSGRFSGLKKSALSPPTETPERAAPRGAKVRDYRDRAGKKAVVGYFSPDVNRGLRLLTIETGSNIQALIGEAIDDLMRKHGKHPFGER